jgi:hypothetical protein
MKISATSLRRLIKEEIAFSQSGASEMPQQQISINDDLVLWLGSIVCCRDWFHGAHFVTKGPTFGGDHVNVFGRIYSDIESSFDSDVEKAVGVTGDINVACPQKLSEFAIASMQRYPSPCTLSADDLATTGLTLVKDHIALVEKLFKKLEATNGLTLGLNDHLSGQANDYETFVYLLQQRSN